MIMEKIGLFGPSHIVRYEHALKNGIISLPNKKIEYIYGYGGIPIWNHIFLSKIESQVNVKQLIHVIYSQVILDSEINCFQKMRSIGNRMPLG